MVKLHCLFCQQWLELIYKGDKIAVVEAAKKREVTDDDACKASVTDKQNTRKTLIQQRKRGTGGKNGDREDDVTGERESRRGIHEDREVSLPYSSVYSQIYEMK